MKDFGHKKIREREDEYHQKRLNRQQLSPERTNPFEQPSGKAASKGMLPQKRTYYDIMNEQSLENEKSDVMRKVAQKEEELKRSHDQQDRLKRQKIKDDTTSTGSVTIKSHI